MPVTPQMIEVALAALLHDVGKPYERTGVESENLDHLFKYSHAGFTSRFFEDIQRDEGDCGWKGVSLVRIKTLASYHHNPSDTLQKLIATADHCSAGERLAMDGNETRLPYGKSRRPLLSLFSQINLQPEKTNAEWWKYDPASLARHDECVFPQPLGQPAEEGKEKYDRLHTEFYDRIRNLRNCPTALLVEAVMGVCRSSWSLIPSSARSDEVPDITLYDHSVVSAAIACALFAQQQSETDADKNRKKMLLVSGDVSGIQDFLLDLPNQASPGTAKLLRARSFYVTMLTRVAIVMILDRLGLPACNCLKDAGGQFTLLVPNTVAVHAELKKLRRELEEWTLRTFQGRLALILSEPVEIDDADFLEGRYGEFAEELKVQTDIAKKQKFRFALQTGSGWNIDAATMDTVPPDERSLDKRLKQLGTALTSAKYIVLSRKTDDNPDHLHFFDTLTLDLQHRLENVSDALAVFEINPENETTTFAAPYSMARHVPRLTQEEADELNKEKLPDEEEWRENQVRPFELIAKSAEGVKCLAVLKADVDRLGQIFFHGLKKKKNATLSRFAVLSRFLNGVRPQNTVCN